MFLVMYGFGWLWSIFSSFWFWLDSTIFNFSIDLYNLLLLISRTSILSQYDIKQFADRIQLLLGIFMLFKIGFSLVMYTVNPDDFSDGSKGVGKILGNTIISLTMLVLVPYIFNMGYKFQSLVLEDNTLGRLILGDSESSDYLQDAGDLMAFQAMIPFFKPNVSIEELMDTCVELYDTSYSVGDGETKSNRFNPECKKSLLDLVETYNKGAQGEAAIENYITGVENSSVGLTFRLSTINLSYGVKDNEQYIFEYRWPLTTVVGVVLCLLLVTFCIDVAVRSLKLSFLQLIAPIPILSIIDPKGTKDSLFSKWGKLCVSTYLSLFLRLMALFFGIYIISKIGTLYDNVDGSIISNGLVHVFIIIGVLFFVKQLPKILENLGFKLDGGFTLNPLKKMEEGMVGGKAVGKIGKTVGKGALIGVGGAAAVGAASLVAGKGLRGTGKAIGSALKGGFKGEKFGRNFSNSYGAGKARKQEISKMKLDGVKPRQVAIENLKNRFAGMTEKDKYDDFSSTLKSIKEGYKNYEAGVAGADKIAKEFKRRKELADNSGDHDTAQKMQDAFDARMKEIQRNSGRVILDADTADVGKIVNETLSRGQYQGLDNITDGSLKSKMIDNQIVDQGLVNIKNNITQSINHLNENYNGRFDYTGNLDAENDLKKINGKTSSVSRAAESSEEARKIEDLYKYVKTESKK